MNAQKMKETLDSIMKAKFKADSFFFEEPPRPKAGKPATLESLRELDHHFTELGLKVPASYRLALSIYDGIENFLGEGYNLLPVRDVIRNEFEFFEEDLVEFPNCCQFLIASAKTHAFMSFDVSSSSEGAGYQVVEVSSEGTEYRTDNFDNFINKYLATLEETIADEEKDRQNLTDSE